MIPQRVWVVGKGHALKKGGLWGNNPFIPTSNSCAQTSADILDVVSPSQYLFSLLSPYSIACGVGRKIEKTCFNPSDPWTEPSSSKA